MKEYGSMRAIGMSGRQLVKMIIAIVLVTSLLAVKGSAKRLQRMSIVENINAQ